jgi:hypothetical protein
MLGCGRSAERAAAAVVAAAVSWFAFERPILALKRFFVTAPTSDSATPEPPERPAFAIEIDARLAKPRRPSRFVSRSILRWARRYVG